ncbi:hypothetical protein [Massilia oculi]|uniref:hypothetical protein n=1 Tax=Massilia oculi TaxID=945844 RepID=UPI001E57CCE3|nr:hypothetical protein [Massilia oculi]
MSPGYRASNAARGSVWRASTTEVVIGNAAKCASGADLVRQSACASSAHQVAAPARAWQATL